MLDRELSLGYLTVSDFEFLLYSFGQIAMIAYQTDSLISITLGSILHDYQGTIHLESNSLVRMTLTMGVTKHLSHAQDLQQVRLVNLTCFMMINNTI